MLFVCAVLDPRYKIKYIEWNIKRLCDYDFEISSYITSRVKETLDKLSKYYEFTDTRSNISFTDNSGCVGDLATPFPGLDMYAILNLERSKAYENDMIAEASHNNKFELDMYFFDRFDTKVNELDILLWWKVNATKYPTFSKMARDLLDVPVSTVLHSLHVVKSLAQIWLKIPNQLILYFLPFPVHV